MVFLCDTSSRASAQAVASASTSNDQPSSISGGVLKREHTIEKPVTTPRFVIQDEVDTILEKMDGRIQRGKNPQMWVVNHDTICYLKRELFEYI